MQNDTSTKIKVFVEKRMKRIKYLIYHSLMNLSSPRFISIAK